MCDTLVLGDGDPSVFGKNSDRDPGELQLLQYSTGSKEELFNNPCQEKLSKYLEGPYKNLKAYAETWSGGIPALVSRPAWIWGAEMGVNLHGLAIGNEAVFSREKATPGGLLGMDILRLALHSRPSAAEALGFITGLIEKYGQGGNGSYKGTLRYHNSFLIKDPGEAFVLETSGRHWVSRRVSGHASISNAYTLIRDFDDADGETTVGFKGSGENPLITAVARGRVRQAFTSLRLSQGTADLKTFKGILRSHPGGGGRIKKHMGSVCMHARGIASSETTASMIVVYAGGGFTVWVTGAPFPCVSLYKPLTTENFQEPRFSDPSHILRYAEEAADFNRRLLSRPVKVREELRRLAEGYEEGFEEALRGTKDRKKACAEAWAQEEAFRREAEVLLK